MKRRDELTEGGVTELFFKKHGHLPCGRRTDACVSVQTECVCAWSEGPTSPVDLSDCYMPPASAHTGHLQHVVQVTFSVSDHVKLQAVS